MRKLCQLSKGSKGDRYQIDEITYARVGDYFKCVRMRTREEGRWVSKNRIYGS